MIMITVFHRIFRARNSVWQTRGLCGNCAGIPVYGYAEFPGPRGGGRGIRCRVVAGECYLASAFWSSASSSSDSRPGVGRLNLVIAKRKTT